MLISDIRPMSGWGKRPRFRVYIDEEFAFTLYESELPRYGIETGHTLSEAAYQEIVGSLLPKRAKARTLHMLARRRHAEGELRSKLKNGGYPDAIVDGAVEYARSYGYLDDAAYARDYIRCHHKKRGKARILYELAAVGIERDVAADIYFEELSQNNFLALDRDDFCV